MISLVTVEFTHEMKNDFLNKYQLAKHSLSVCDLFVSPLFLYVFPDPGWSPASLQKLYLQLGHS